MSLAVAAAVHARGVRIALSVPRGQTLALAGPNGAGKSTVLELVAGLCAADEGTVRAGDTVLDDLPIHRRGVALLAQDPHLFPHLRVLANVAYGPRSQGLSRAASRARARDWLRRVGAEELADRRPSTLSGGQAQRVAIARALAAEPDVVLLDEPFAALDVTRTPELRALLRSTLVGRTALVATHDPLDALLLADQVAVLQDGRVVEQGPAARVLSRPQTSFAARFAGLNQLGGTWSDGALRADDGSRWHGAEPAGPLADGTPVWAVFRPGAVHVSRHRPEPGHNRCRQQVQALEQHLDQLRLRTATLTADLAPAQVGELAPRLGEALWFSAAPPEVTVYPALTPSASP